MMAKLYQDDCNINAFSLRRIGRGENCRCGGADCAGRCAAAAFGGCAAEDFTSAPAPAGCRAADPAGLSGASAFEPERDACLRQMRGILRQLMRRAPHAAVEITLAGGDCIDGRLGEMCCAADGGPGAGLLLLTDAQGARTAAVRVDRIASVRVPDGRLCNALDYLPPPADPACACGGAAAIRDFLPAGTDGVSLRACGRTIAAGRVTASEYGAILLADDRRGSVTIACANHVEAITSAQGC